MTSLGTHVLDTMHGRPASGLKVTLSGPDGEIARGMTNGDGRCPELAQAGLAPGRYTLRFAVADYFRGLGVALPDPPVGSSRVDLQACKLEYSIVSPK